METQRLPTDIIIRKSTTANYCTGINGIMLMHVEQLREHDGTYYWNNLT